MPRESDETIEERISMKILVDAYNEEERAMSWYYYLKDMLSIPFQAKVVAKRKISPLSIGEIVEVISMGSEDDCMHEMFVNIHYENDVLSIPLAQVETIDTDEETQQAVNDWRYWIERGYEL